MKLSAEISLYPLMTEQYRDVINQFIERLSAHPDLVVRVNTMSTQIFGEYRDVMRILTDELEQVYAQVPPQILVCKFINKDLNPYAG
ncbi:MAG: thiamine-binding protein [Idiomarina sp.]|nr:thiamine-binding protein [Idiomarina sp.]